MSERRVFKWTPAQLDKLNKVKEILEELEDYKPLTLRQVYYQLVGKGYIENNKSQYGMLSGLLKAARISGKVSWDDIEDRVRKHHDLTGYSNAEEFINLSLISFLKNYSRDIMQSQDKFIEIWIEKDALSSIFTRTAERYGISVVVCRGFSSVSFIKEYADRIKQHKGKKPVMLYFGDFDPSGVEMLKAMIVTLETELNILGIDFKRVALMKSDIKKYNLPHSPDALKTSDTRSAKHIKEYGELAVELDALRPDILEEKIRDAIINEINVDLFNKEIEIHNSELDKLNELREKVISSIL